MSQVAGWLVLRSGFWSNLRMRVAVACALLFTSDLAYAQSARCSERTDEELKPSAPARVAGCESFLADWQAASHADPSDCEAMKLRIAARDDLNHCNALMLSKQLSPEQLAAQGVRTEALRERQPARNLLLAGAVVLALGGAGMTAIGVTGTTLSIQLNSRRSFDGGGWLWVVSELGAGFAAFASIAIPGVIMLSLGAHRYARVRRALAF